MVAAVAIPAILSIPALRGDGPRDERPIVPLDRLLLPRPATGLPGDPAWSLYGTWQMDGRPRDNLARQWSGNGDDARLAQTVQRYATAADAHRAYLGSDPIARAAEQAESSAVPGSVPDGVDADTSVVGCVGGRPPECHVWIYWARYGQYNVSLSSANVDSRVPYDTFAAHVLDVDRTMTSGLSR